jgi:hypothetical protein
LVSSSVATVGRIPTGSSLLFIEGEGAAQSTIEIQPTIATSLLGETAGAILTTAADAKLAFDAATYLYGGGRMFKLGSMRSGGEPLSLQDRILGCGAAFSALYCVAVSFMLFQDGASKRFVIGLVVFAFCFFFVRQKKGVALGIGAFIAVRIVWGLIAAALQRPK